MFDVSSNRNKYSLQVQVSTYVSSFSETESWHLLSSSECGPAARHKHSAVLHDDAMYIYGGMTDLQERSDCWRWDVHTTSWCILKNKPGPGPLHGHAACRLPSCMLIFGGESGGLATNELWRFHFGTYFRNYIILSTIQSYFVNPIRRNNNCNLINDCRSDKSTFDYLNFRN